MTRYRKLPVEIDAIQFTRDTFRAAVRFVPIVQFSAAGEDDQGRLYLDIRTLEGTMRADENDWIIRGVKGEHYPCKPDIFATTYEPVTSAAGVAPAADQTLRGRIAEARDRLRGMALSLATGSGPLVEPKEFDAAIDAYADTVLAVLGDQRTANYAETAETLRSDLYDDLDQFARETGIPGLQHAQIRDHLAVFLTEGLLRRMAAGAQQPAADGEEETPEVCQGFVWIGQSFATCDRCTRPAWEHDGEDVPVEGAGPFDTRRTVRPWKPGQADAIRAKWGPRP